MSTTLFLESDQLKEAKILWLDQVFRKSESERSRKVAQVSLNMFEYFCEDKGSNEIQVINEYQELFKEGNIDEIISSLDGFVKFLNEDHKDIILNPNKKMETYCKRKNPRTIRIYFGFVKSYLRKVHRIKISNEDIKDIIIFPRERKTLKKAITIEILKSLFSVANPTRRALYSVLISSGMRISEALSLKKEDFHLDENPVRISINAEITKTKEDRETYISRESSDKVRPIIEEKGNDERVFTHLDNTWLAVIYEEKYFQDLRKKLGLLEKYKNSNRYVVNIHRMRAYFHTKATTKHGADYAHALDGHGAYLKTYYDLTDEERAKMYKELEPHLLVESYSLESEKSKDKKIERLQEEMKKLQDKMTRIELLNNS